MKEDIISKALLQFNVRDYIAAARVSGRAGMDPDVQLQAATLYEEVRRYRLTEPFMSNELASTLELVERTLYSEWFFLNHKHPRYPAYTNVRVLNWVLNT